MLTIDELHDELEMILPVDPRHTKYRNYLIWPSVHHPFGVGWSEGEDPPRPWW